MRNGGAGVWISSARTVFPLALKRFGITPDHIIFVDLQKQKDLCWAMEEALKCGALTAVVGELNDLDFTASRRMQLAVEKSQVTGFIIRHQPGTSVREARLNTTASITRWKITAIPSERINELPGLGFPRWNVE